MHSSCFLYECRRISGEYLGVAFFNKLQLQKCFRACGFSQRQLEIAMLLIIGRLVQPGSERHIHRWAQHLSGLDELIKTDFNRLSPNPDEPEILNIKKQIPSLSSNVFVGDKTQTANHNKQNDSYY